MKNNLHCFWVVLICSLKVALINIFLCIGMAFQWIGKTIDMILGFGVLFGFIAIGFLFVSIFGVFNWIVENVEITISH